MATIGWTQQQAIYIKAKFLWDGFSFLIYNDHNEYQVTTEQMAYSDHRGIQVLNEFHETMEQIELCDRKAHRVFQVMTVQMESMVLLGL